MEAPPVRSLLERLAWRADCEAAQEAFEFDGRSSTYGEIWSKSRRFAGGLHASDLERGGRVVLSLANGPDFFVAFYGTLLAGGIAVPVYPGVGAPYLRQVADRCGASLIVAAANSPLAGARALPFGEVLESGSPAAELRMPAPDDIAYLQYTSGSTGEPKGVRITHANLLVNIEQMIRGMEITARDVFVSWLPVCHDMGLVLMTMVPFYLGARLTLLPASLREIRSWLSRIDRKQGTFTAAPDFAYRLCLRHVRNPEDYDLSSLRVALNAAEPVRRKTLAEFESAFALHNVMVPGYGLAEATVGVAMWPPGVAVKSDRRGFVSVGRGFPGVELAVLAETGLADANEIGEILVKSAANTRGYWGSQQMPDEGEPKPAGEPPSSSSGNELFYQRDFLRTGDLGYLDDDGDLFVIGRMKNIIIQGGRNIAPKEVEDALDALSFTRLSAAVGIDRGSDAGEQLYAFVEVRGRPPTDRDELRRLSIEATREIRSHLGLSPGRVYLAAARTIPRTRNGKIRYNELRRLYEDGTLRRQGKLLFPEY